MKKFIKISEVAKNWPLLSRRRRILPKSDSTR